jgi:hypothetical protein
LLWHCVQPHGPKPVAPTCGKMGVRTGRWGSLNPGAPSMALHCKVRLLGMALTTYCARSVASYVLWIVRLFAEHTSLTLVYAVARSRNGFRDVVHNDRRGPAIVAVLGLLSCSFPTPLPPCVVYLSSRHGPYRREIIRSTVGNADEA